LILFKSKKDAARQVNLPLVWRLALGQEAAQPPERRLPDAVLLALQNAEWERPARWSGLPVTIAINELAREALDWLTEPRYGDSLFMWPCGDRIGTVTVYDASNRSCDAAELTDFRFNDLRPTFASHLAMSSTDLLTLKDLLGHTNIQ
jgi:integrase